jgi:hypothetical protein
LTEEVIMRVLNRLASAKRITLVAAGLVLAGGSVLALPGRALADPTYRFGATAHISSGAPASDQDALGCASANDCVTVGPDLAKTFNGRQVAAIPGLNGPGTMTADGIDPNDWHAASCAADGACMIVSVDGFVAGHSAFRASAKAPWTRVAMPMPKPDNDLDAWLTAQSVSCSSATFCLAAASFSDDINLGSQVWRWDGHAWHLGNLKPSEPGFGGVYFSAVSCAAAWQCVVVGHRFIEFVNSFGANELGSAPFRAVLDGNKWSVANLPVPRGTVDVQADAVSCWSVHHCRITGSATDQPNRNVVSVWTWAGQAFSATTGYQDATSPKLDSMSCTSATFCVAAGVDDPAKSGHSEHLDLLWNGTAWTSLAIHRTALSGSGVVFTTTNGVACSTAYACRLVGNDTNFTAYGTFLDSLQAT